MRCSGMSARCNSSRRRTRSRTLICGLSVVPPAFVGADLGAFALSSASAAAMQAGMSAHLRPCLANSLASLSRALAASGACDESSRANRLRMVRQTFGGGKFTIALPILGWHTGTGKQNQGVTSAASRHSCRHGVTVPGARSRRALGVCGRTPQGRHTAATHGSDEGRRCRSARDSRPLAHERSSGSYRRVAACG